MSRPHLRAWQLQDAKNRFSEVVDEALAHGPQVITRRGTETAVVLSFEQFVKLSRSRRPLVELLLRAPRLAKGLDVERSTDTGRDVEL